MKKKIASLRPPRRPFLFALVLALFAFAALADTTSGPINGLPKNDIMQDNGTPNAKGFSWDPQIAQAVTSSTGMTFATTSLTVGVADTTFTTLRGASISNTTRGFVAIGRSGLYRLQSDMNCAAANGETSSFEISSTLDDTNYTTCTAASFVALTGALTQGVHMLCYLPVTSSQAAALSGALAGGGIHVVVRGKNSAGTTTCKSTTALSVERVDQLQPPAYP